MTSVDEVLHLLRSDPRHAEHLRELYFDEDFLVAASRFQESGEFLEVQRLLSEHIRGKRILDLGAGRGIASRALAQSGAALVYALEPDPSDDIGCGAIAKWNAGLPIQILNASSEQIPLPDCAVDVVYARQVLHHLEDLPGGLRECARILRRGGVFLASREHVVDDEKQLKIHLDNHYGHQLLGGEHAFSVAEYVSAIEGAGLKVEKTLGPWDSVINNYPKVKSPEELTRYPRIALERRLGILGTVISCIPGVKSIVRHYLNRPVPGRLYTFLARKV